jgi:hypothetical protein
MKTTPKVTLAEVKSWCPVPRGNQTPGHHANVPPLDNENAPSPGGYDDNRTLTQKIVTAFLNTKPVDPVVSGIPDSGPRFVIQWRIFPNASNPIAADPNQCGCGCSCGCG